MVTAKCAPRSPGLEQLGELRGRAAHTVISLSRVKEDMGCDGEAGYGERNFEGGDSSK